VRTEICLLFMGQELSPVIMRYTLIMSVQYWATRIEQGFDVGVHTALSYNVDQDGFNYTV
jgi:hypothetical protein